MKNVLALIVFVVFITGCTTYSNIEKYKNDYSKFPQIGLANGPCTIIGDAEKAEVLLKINYYIDKHKQVREIWNYITTNYRNGKITDGASIRSISSIIITKELKHCGEYGALWSALLILYGIPCLYISTIAVDSAKKPPNSWYGHVFIYAFIDTKYYLIDSTRGVLFIDYDDSQSYIPVQIEGFSDNGFIEMFRCIDIGNVIKGDESYKYYVEESRRKYPTIQIPEDNYYLREYKILDNDWLF